MKHLATVFSLAAAVLLLGCAGAPRPAAIVPSTSITGSPGTLPIPYLAGNWQFSALSTIPGNPPLSFAGGISQAGSVATAALHVVGSNCFNQLTTMGLTATVTAAPTALTFTPLNGQVVSFTGSFSGSAFTGTYSISGGCAAGDRGSVTGVAISIADADSWGGTFTSSAQKTFNVAGDFHQGTTASSEGSVQVIGTAAFDTPCFSAATLNPGSFPSGSFILGSLVSIEMKTNNGTVTFIGTVDPSTEILDGSYNVSGGTCDGTGTAHVILTGQWDY